MEDNLTKEENQGHQSEDSFFPKGSIAFFLIMTVFFIAVWFAFYALTMVRG